MTNFELSKLTLEQVASICEDHPGGCRSNGCPIGVEMCSRMFGNMVPMKWPVNSPTLDDDQKAFLRLLKKAGFERVRTVDTFIGSSRRGLYVIRRLANTFEEGIPVEINLFPDVPVEYSIDLTLEEDQWVWRKNKK